ncbi:MAG TPA: hypothetical protein VNQ34_08815 [Xanthobacteraceae bacterium]|jgi:hypothetical protein|nr:hypothetical protein [Xanthobacteraceae bacterium]
MFRRYGRSSNKVIILINPGWSNPGDGLAALGVQSSLHALGFKNLYQYSIEDHALWIQLFSPDEIHAVVLAGTPWIWDRCHDSEKFRCLIEVRKRLHRAKWIMAGGGASFLAQHIQSNFTDAAVDLSVFSDFQICITRDFVARNMLQKVNKNCLLLPCPSTILPVAIDARFSRVEKTEKRLFEHDLRNEFLAPYLDSEFLTQYEKTCADGVLRGFRPTAWGCRDEATEPNEILLRLASCREFLTSRVHAAISSFSLGAEGKLFACDSRTFTAMHLGIEVCGPYTELLKRAFIDQELFETDGEKTRQLYMRILNDALN